MKILELDQNTDPWGQWRQAGIGSSDAACLMLPDYPYKTRTELFRNKKGQIEKQKDSYVQRRGHDLEPVARKLYHQMRGIQTRPVCVIHDDHDWLRASLDGLSLDNLRILEIKCIKAEYHQMVLNGKVPPIYWPQVQHQLLVTGLKDLDFWSYSESTKFPLKQRVALTTVTPDREYQQALFQAEMEFWESLQSD